MKTFKHQSTGNIRQTLLMEKKSIRGLAILSVVLLWSCATPIEAQRVEVGINFNLPSWAPYYNNPNLVRYYYLPDIECYYDVMNREFIYMEDGEWMFGRTLPPVYAWFNLNNCFVVTLDARVVQPWRHFHYYVAHYPRYYYRTVYRDIYMDRNRHLRGFNENERNVVFNHRSEMEEYSRSRKNNDYRREENNRFENRRENEDRREGNNRFENNQENLVRRNSPERRVEPTQPAQPMNYYGREIGRPVKVQRNMKRAEETRGNQGTKANQETRVKQEKQVKEHRQR
jgi:hypothetical protein